MFRGVLYRHLRDSTHRLSFWASALLSAAVSSLVFARFIRMGIATAPPGVDRDRPVRGPRCAWHARPRHRRARFAQRFTMVLLMTFAG